jgi:hypothetical protein
MGRWVVRNVPGATFQILRCDFGTEMAQQGHGNTVVLAFQLYCRNHAWLSRPVAPYSQALTKTKSTWGPVHGRSFAIACRARLGPPAWSLTLRDAAFQHNHNAATRVHDTDARSQTRAFRLTGRTLGCLHHAGVHRPRQNILAQYE